MDGGGPVWRRGKNHPVTVLAGLKTKLGADAQMTYVDGPKLSKVYPGLLDMMTGNKPLPPPTAEETADWVAKVKAAAADADVVIAVMGENASMSSEAASRATLDLPGIQEQMLEAAVSTGKPVVLVLREWAAARYSVGIGACAGDSGGVVSGNGRRQCGGGCAVRRCKPGRKTAGELAANCGRRAALLQPQPDA